MMLEVEKEGRPKGLIFNIQRYSIHDGPGIRTTVFLKGCPLRCFWCQNPESQEMKPELLLDRSRCSSCGRCTEVCPSRVNVLMGDRITMHRDKCQGCGECADACPSGARKLSGKWVTAEEVMDEILRDKVFYDNSGGGVTLSGGEPLMQADFCLQLLRRCKEEGLNTALDTCGYAPEQTLMNVLAFTDLVLYDMKCLDTTKHRNATGRSNELILKNAKIIAQSKKMHFRIPLVPGFNDSEEEIRDITVYVRKKLGCFNMDLHPYNTLGEGKYDRLDRPSVRLVPQSDEDVEKLREILTSE
jgi:pyruvate formate lyase activating enzyme